MSYYAIVYSTASKALRRIIASDVGLDGNEVSANAVSVFKLANGESVIYVAAGQNHGHVDWANAVQQATGVAPPTLTCALIDNTNTVQQVIVADPAIDAAPGNFTMVACYSPSIAVGCTYSAATGLFTAPGYTIPPNTPANPSAIPVVVPPQVIPNPNAGSVQKSAVP